MKNGTSEMISAAEAYNKWAGAKTSNAGQINRWLEHFKLEIIATAHLGGKAPVRFISREAFERVPPRSHPRLESNPTERPAESQAEMHLGALEAKVDRLNDRVGGLTDEVNVLVKQANLMIDKLNEVLKQLGQ